MSTLTPASAATSRRRGSSSSTVKGPRLPYAQDTPKRPSGQPLMISATTWVHFDKDSIDDMLIHATILENAGIREGDLVEVRSIQSSPQARDFQPSGRRNATPSPHRRPSTAESRKHAESKAICLVKVAPSELASKQASFEVSLNHRLATAFGIRPRSDVEIRPASLEDHVASHVEFSFRDVYLARSDMWRLVGQELAGKVVHTGQRITFLGSVRLVVKAVHVNGHRVATGYFSGNTIPVFRSEAARYVIFIQMSREMWDFDSEGNGEILFNRVINGFLPDLFKRWTELEVRHLVSIVLFSRQEYSMFEVADQYLRLPSKPNARTKSHSYQDFYKVVVTDMASAQWTTILDELKKNFRVFLRDVSLHRPVDDGLSDTSHSASHVPKITGRPTTAMKGNILEAINLASTQFSDDYLDRDLIRTGISVVVVTAGAGVFEVDRTLLNLTSENLTNNGIGIDIVCLSKMPLHSVPLFKYRTSDSADFDASSLSGTSSSPQLTKSQAWAGVSASSSFKASPLINSVHSSSAHPLSRYSSSLHMHDPDKWAYGIPHWIDLSYWSPEGPKSSSTLSPLSKHEAPTSKHRKAPFTPRVRMYEVQMMGLMEMGMADISIPWMSETQQNELHQRRRRKPSQRTGSRSLSHSPKISRRSLRLESASSREHGLLSAGTRLLGGMFNRMDTYEDGLFKRPHRKRHAVTSPSKRSKGVYETKQVLASKLDSTETDLSLVQSREALMATHPKLVKTESSPGSDTASIATLSKHRSPEAIRAARNASYALRGLAPPMRAVASTEINVENVQAHMHKTESLKTRPSIANSAQSIRSLSYHKNISQASGVSRAANANQLSPVSSRTDSDRPSTPIRISNSAAKANVAPNGEGHRHTKSDHSLTTTAREHDDLSDQDAGAASGTEGNGSDSPSDEETWDSFPSSVPKSTLPFIRNVNASNPLKGNPNRESFFGRWQHLYPRKPRAATVKWRSLCTPASVPLTTEDFPSKDELDKDFDQVSYIVSFGETEEIVERPESRDGLLREMLSLRFSHGYQLVVGARMNKFEGPGLHDASFFFNPEAQRHDGQYLFMSMGNTIQKLALLERNRIGVTRYQRKPFQAQETLPKQVSYNHYVQTILSARYVGRTMQLEGFAEQYPWKEADAFLANPSQGPDNEVQRLRFWRARFVLLPVEPPANASRSTAADGEENEEDIHLRGIRALTQIWQKIRYIPPEDRRPAQNRMSSFKPKDRNPLRINMETLNPSELVATELDKLVAAEEAGDVQTTQLLPEDEQFDRESVKLGKLAAALQGERGIEIRNRRWHLRLHYSCFHGEEFTNWLVQNVRDIDTREEAVSFGNELMKEGLFEHVNSRHNFKDGNFFYSIKSEWRAPKQSELKQSWLTASRRSDKSVPPTPLVEQPPSQTPLTTRTRSASSLAVALSAQTSPEMTRPVPERKRLAVSLSKMIRLDVDTRKRSDRPEIVSLHYDRLHNPENCYHLELSWLNVTSKLVDDAIVSWTTTAERYGLKLVEVPIVEASRVPENEPFRAPYIVKLAQSPPKGPLATSGNGNVYFTATSFTPHQSLNSDLHFYQKAILKRFNFVLDIEGISEFPDNVEINYSWGRLNYKYTQFIHRSGVILAQITDQGGILLLANRLYNSRLASARDTSSKLETTKQLHAAAQNLRPASTALAPFRPETQMPASGIVGINVQSPSLSTTSNLLSSPSPLIRPLPRPLALPPLSAPATTTNSASPSAVNSTSSVPLAATAHLRSTPVPAHTPLSTPGLAGMPTSNPIATSAAAAPAAQAQERVSADVFGSRHALASASLATYVTPEQIKDDLERFCSDPNLLQAFYVDVQAIVAAAAQSSAAGTPSGEGTPGQTGSEHGQLQAAGQGGGGKAASKEGGTLKDQKKRGSTSSSLLRPVPEAEMELNDSAAALSGIPEMKLPESVQARLTGGFGVGGRKREAGEGSG
ncbi:uncharacterized protein HMPREF1541_04152 [Cyphellophora europaea CBS 101466]|uniref:Vacuolar membrane-associated protein IML1 n=1 Tax=Cyphellophora europaea (strain CBS 101466) TaxID=1220924 RepID=W2S0E6_CYPE1|nr:uncharacterized protein HMPREF1541_04152 [Cyphellophora europaea CBS 101466]ETN42211.1 hypothetical protein HMPREF1541_04152 [Cyphellophora europaea CBS 101466]